MKLGNMGAKATPYQNSLGGHILEKESQHESVLIETLCTTDKESSVILLRDKKKVFIEKVILELSFR